MKYRYSVNCYGPGIGIGLFLDGKYVSTYLSFNDCVMDIVYHYGIDEIENLKHEIQNLSFEKFREPYQYRAICSEYFFPTEQIINYVFFADTMSEILEKIEIVEKRSLTYPAHFMFAPQGIGVHLFDKKKMNYVFWTGGNKIQSIADLISQLHTEGKFVTSKLLEELRSSDYYDVFLSHKSEDIVQCKKLYDFLVQCGYKVFLSEVSLPVLANTDYASEIDHALDVSNNLIVICNSIENVLSGWVKFEWSAFANELRSGRKKGNLLSYNIGDIANSLFPLTLRQYEIIPGNQMEQIPSFLRQLQEA